MSKITFTEDPSSRKVTRVLFLSQIIGMGIVLILSLRHLVFPAVAISFLTLSIFLLILLWLYARYREFPIVREKRKLEGLVLKFQKGVHTEEENIQATVRERARLFQAEKEEISTTLETLQRKHIENGLRMASIHEAAISEVGPKLKERLAGYDILSAADITEKIAELPGLGAEERQALMGWRHSVLAHLESTQPSGLPQKQLEAIQQKFQAWQGRNNAIDRRSRASQQMLEYELISFRERLHQLAPFTFPRYLSRSLASRQIVAAPLAFALIITQVVSSVSATASSIISWIPTATATPTMMHRPARKATNTITEPPTATVAATETISALQTSTFTLTSAPTETAISTQTQLPTLTLTPTATRTAFLTFTLQPSNTAIIPVSGGGNTGGCDPSYPGVCIPLAPPDLDCKDVPYKRFQVLPPDPHKFDRDGDGIGCES